MSTTVTAINTYSVRKVRLEELDYLINMGGRLHEESLFKHMRYDHEKLHKFATLAVNGNRQLFLYCIVHNPTNVPVGMFFAGAHEMFFGPDLVSNDFLLLIEKEHRGKCSHELKLMLESYKAWAQQLGVKRIYLGTSTGIEPERTAKLYEACGFAQIGTIHEVGR